MDEGIRGRGEQGGGTCRDREKTTREWSWSSRRKAGMSSINDDGSKVREH